MSTRTHLAPYTVFNAVSMASDQTSTPTVLSSLSSVSFDISWTGTSPVGTIEVQISNSYKLNAAGQQEVAGSWTTVPVMDSSGSIVSSIPVSGNTGSAFIDVVKTAGYAIRLFFDSTSGTGSLTAVVTGKVS